MLYTDMLKSFSCSNKSRQASTPNHKAVSISINEKGKAYWKLDNEKEYDKGIENIYDTVIMEYNDLVSTQFLWD